MATVYDINPNKLIEKAASELKKIEGMKAPEWSKFVKTSHSKERPPEDKDWWYFRSAAILRSVYLLGPVGVNKLRTKYGSKKNRGYKPEKFYKSSGKIIRIIMQQLTKADLIKSTEKGSRKGKVITSKGKSLLDRLSKNDSI